MIRGSSLRRAGAMAARTLDVLHFNDLYHVDNFQGKSERAVRMALALEPHIRELNPLVTFGGDLLAPSLMSSVTKGKHMVEALELLGAHVGTLGNHDFDFGIHRVRELTQDATLFHFEGPPSRGKVDWVMSNISGLDGEPAAGAHRWLLREWQGVLVGIVAVSENWLADAGLSAESSSTDKHAKWEEEVASARKWARHVRQQGAEIVLGLCHDLVKNTKRLAHEVSEVDFWLGGHEHIYLEGDRFVIAGYDFDDFCLLRFQVPAESSGEPLQPPQLRRVQVPADTPTEQELRCMKLEGTAARMRSLVEHYSKEVEHVLSRPLGCSLSGELDTRKFGLRTQETIAGNLFADAIFESLRSKGAECCLIIAGMVSSGPGKTPAGPLTLGNVVSWFPWEGGTCILELSGETILEALEHGCHKLPLRYGMFPQVSGMSFGVAVDPKSPSGSHGAPGSRVSEVTIAGQPVEPARLYKVATSEYLADGGDDYKMLVRARRLVDPEMAPLLHDAVSSYLLAKGPEVPLPPIEGRIRHLHGFQMRCEPEELGATLQDPVLEETMVRAWTARAI